MLQAYYYLPAFQYAVLTWQPAQGLHHCSTIKFMAALQLLFARLKWGNRVYEDPSEVMETLFNTVERPFGPTGQQDLQEFAVFFLERIQKGLLHGADKTAVLNEIASTLPPEELAVEQPPQPQADASAASEPTPAPPPGVAAAPPPTILSPPAAAAAAAPTTAPASSAAPRQLFSAENPRLPKINLAREATVTVGDGRSALPSRPSAAAAASTSADPSPKRVKATDGIADSVSDENTPLGNGTNNYTVTMAAAAPSSWPRSNGLLRDAVNMDVDEPPSAEEINGVPPLLLPPPPPAAPQPPPQPTAQETGEAYCAVCKLLKCLDRPDPDAVPQRFRIPSPNPGRPRSPQYPAQMNGGAGHGEVASGAAAAGATAAVPATPVSAPAPMLRAQSAKTPASLVTDMFQGCLRVQLEYTDEHNQHQRRANLEPFFFHTVNVGSVHPVLSQALLHMLDPAAVDYKTEGGKATKGARTVWFERVPPVIMFQLQRLEFDKVTRLTRKNNQAFSFDKVIDLDLYTFQCDQLRKNYVHHYTVMYNKEQELRKVLVLLEQPSLVSSISDVVGKLDTHGVPDILVQAVETHVNRRCGPYGVAVAAGVGAVVGAGAVAGPVAGAAAGAAGGADGTAETSGNATVKIAKRVEGAGEVAACGNAAPAQPSPKRSKGESGSQMAAVQVDDDTVIDLLDSMDDDDDFKTEAQGTVAAAVPPNLDASRKPGPRLIQTPAIRPTFTATGTTAMTATTVATTATTAEPRHAAEASGPSSTDSLSVAGATDVPSVTTVPRAVPLQPTLLSANITTSLLASLPAANRSQLQQVAANMKLTNKAPAPPQPPALHAVPAAVAGTAAAAASASAAAPPTTTHLAKQFTSRAHQTRPAGIAMPLPLKAGGGGVRRADSPETYDDRSSREDEDEEQEEQEQFVGSEEDDDAWNQSPHDVAASSTQWSPVAAAQSRQRPRGPGKMQQQSKAVPARPAFNRPSTPIVAEANRVTPAAIAALIPQLTALQYVVEVARCELQQQLVDLTHTMHNLWAAMHPNGDRHQLHAVFVHEGAPQAGHYRVYVRHAVAGYGEQWYSFNDRTVKAVTFEQVQADGMGRADNTKNAYLLMYTQSRATQQGDLTPDMRQLYERVAQENAENVLRVNRAKEEREREQAERERAERERGKSANKMVRKKETWVTNNVWMSKSDDADYQNRLDQADEVKGREQRYQATDPGYGTNKELEKYFEDDGEELRIIGEKDSVSMLEELPTHMEK